MRKLLITIVTIFSLATFAYSAPTPTPASTATTSLSLDVGTAGFLGYMTTTVTAATAPPTGAPPWGPVYLANDGSASASVNFTVPTGQTSPSNYTLLVNGLCIPTVVGGATCSLPKVPVNFTCSMSGIFQMSFSAAGYTSIPAAIICVPPTQVPS